jgi:hypothetical protein
MTKDSALDSDGDGATNLEEFIAGTSPLDRNFVFRSSLSYVAGSPTATLSWRSAAGKTYKVLSTQTLGVAPELYQTVPSAGDGTTTLTVPASATASFFRIEVNP